MKEVILVLGMNHLFVTKSEIIDDCKLFSNYCIDEQRSEIVVK